jgi:hypothetical protein
MTDRQNFERLRSEISYLLTEYEEYNDRHRDTLHRLENARYLYDNLVLILNDSEGWNKD